jgi:hypothetical protein
MLIGPRAPEDFGQKMTEVILDAQSRLLVSARSWSPDIRDITFSDLDISCHTQGWSDTSIGFSGIGGQALSEATTVVIASTYGEYIVYHGFHFAYLVVHAGEKFYDDLRNHRLVGASDQWEVRYERSYERSKEK